MIIDIYKKRSLLFIGMMLGMLVNCSNTDCDCIPPETDDGDVIPAVTTFVYTRHHNNTEDPYKRVYTITDESVFSLDTYSYVDCDSGGDNCVYDFNSAFTTDSSNYTITDDELLYFTLLLDAVDWSIQTDISDVDATGTCNVGDRQFLISWDDDSVTDITIDGSVSCDDTVVPQALRDIEDQIDAYAEDLP